MATVAHPVGPKPLLRGVSHEVAVAFAVAGGIALLRAASGGRALLAAAVYGFALTAQFTISALYHRPPWGPRARRFMRRLAHSAIFILIAGTFTPFCLLDPSPTARWVLPAVWTGAGAGVLLSVAWPFAPKWLMSALAIALGWMVVPALPSLAQVIGARGLALLLSGGILYSIGALVYATRRPDPFPRVFGYHEVFHALVIVAAVLHFTAVARVVGAIR